jgi:hypothetical protein
VGVWAFLAGLYRDLDQKRLGCAARVRGSSRGYRAGSRKPPLLGAELTKGRKSARVRGHASIEMGSSTYSSNKSDALQQGCAANPAAIPPFDEEGQLPLADATKGKNDEDLTCGQQLVPRPFIIYPSRYHGPLHLCLDAAWTNWREANRRSGEQPLRGSAVSRRCNAHGGFFPNAGVDPRLLRRQPIPDILGGDRNSTSEHLRGLTKVRGHRTPSASVSEPGHPPVNISTEHQGYMPCRATELRGVSARALRHCPAASSGGDDWRFSSLSQLMAASDAASCFRLASRFLGLPVLALPAMGRGTPARLPRLATWLCVQPNAGGHGRGSRARCALSAVSYNIKGIWPDSQPRLRPRRSSLGSRRQRYSV